MENVPNKSPKNFLILFELFTISYILHFKKYFFWNNFLQKKRVLFQKFYFSKKYFFLKVWFSKVFLEKHYSKVTFFLKLFLKWTKNTFWESSYFYLNIINLKMAFLLCQIYYFWKAQNVSGTLKLCNTFT